MWIGQFKPKYPMWGRFAYFLQQPNGKCKFVVPVLTLS